MSSYTPQELCEGVRPGRPIDGPTLVVYRDGWTGVRKSRRFATRDDARQWVRAWNAAQYPRKLTGIRYHADPAWWRIEDRDAPAAAELVDDGHYEATDGTRFNVRCAAINGCAVLDINGQPTGTFVRLTAPWLNGAKRID